MSELKKGKAHIKIGNLEYICDIAVTEEEKIHGLMYIEKLGDNEGMLFIYDEPDELSFWMKNTKLHLDIIFINEDYEVIKIAEGIPENTDIITCDNVQFVLEVNYGSGIKEGDTLEILNENDILESYKNRYDDDESDDVTDIVREEQKEATTILAHVLDPTKGNKIQYSIKGEERIFSIKNVRTLISMSKKANRTKSDTDYKKLGNKVFKFIDIQDNNEEQYVELKEDNE